MQATTTETFATGAARNAPPRTRLVVLALVAVVVGLGVGRFVSYDGGAPSAVVATSDPDQRLAALKQATIARPDDAKAWQALASNYVRLAIVTARPDYFASAREALKEATRLAPDALSTLVSSGTFALTLHQFNDALTFGDRAVATSPFNAEARAVRVDALVELGRYDDAATALQELLDLRPGLAALTRVSYLRQLRGDLDGALTAMRQAQTAAGSQAGEAAIAAGLEGEIQLLRGDFGAARAAFANALRQSPGLIGGELGRARYLDITGRRAEAIRRLEPAVEKTGNPGLAVLLGELYDVEGKTKSAAKAYAVARQVYRDEVKEGAVVDLEVAFLEADHGPPPTALAAAEAAYAARPNIYTNAAMAWTLHRNGRSAEAVPFVEAALARGTVDPTLRMHSAIVLTAAGAPDRAREVIATALARPGYLSPALRPMARATLSELGLAVPAAWR